MWLSNCFALNPLHYTSRIGANNERYNKSIHSLFTATHTQRTIWQRELGNRRRGTFGRTTLYFRDSIISLIKKKQNRDQTCLTSRPARLRLPIPVHQPGSQADKPKPTQLLYSESQTPAATFIPLSANSKNVPTLFWFRKFFSLYQTHVEAQ